MNEGIGFRISYPEDPNQNLNAEGTSKPAKSEPKESVKTNAEKQQNTATKTAKYLQIHITYPDDNKGASNSNDDVETIPNHAHFKVSILTKDAKDNSSSTVEAKDNSSRKGLGIINRIKNLFKSEKKIEMTPSEARAFNIMHSDGFGEYNGL